MFSFYAIPHSQIFFSLSVTFGIMTAYGSYCPRDDPAFCNATTVACANCMFSFIAGFAVFAAVGYLANELGEPVENLKFAGFSLVFGTWPVILSTLPGGIRKLMNAPTQFLFRSNHMLVLSQPLNLRLLSTDWVRLLFFNLFLLGVSLRRLV